MENKELQNRLPASEDAPPISILPPSHSHFRFFAIFLICSALLIAVFAVSAVLVKGGVFGDEIGDDVGRALGVICRVRPHRLAHEGKSPQKNVLVRHTFSFRCLFVEG